MSYWVYCWGGVALAAAVNYDVSATILFVGFAIIAAIRSKEEA